MKHILDLAIKRKMNDDCPDLKIEYNSGRGHMLIHVINFFPTTQDKMKRLLKVIKLSNESEQQLQSVIKQYLDARQEKADQERLVNSRKYPNGVPLTSEEMKEARKEFKQLQRKCNDKNQEINGLKREIKKLKGNLKILTERK